ncbi:Mor transcription activator-like protein [Zobellella denitrificans]|uniref:Mor transcription activator-like protein n=1 Tax=Zobellella denitrificans TaxID=347534 RepID=A0A291HNF5_9GAMM|nr:Mor transcription activator family protein [Zobellella denitrificans]ATG73639.1 Mor transcription activator-like protein [Zobellella denitrificans]
MSRDSVMSLRRHELLEDIHAQVAAVAQDYGIGPDVADQLGCAIADHMASNWGGQHVTIPKDHHYRISSRDLEIYEEFDGRNHHHLARKYDLSVRAIYKIVKRVRANGDPNQQPLF